MANNNNENNVLLELSSPPPSPWDHLVRTLSEGFCGDRSAKQGETTVDRIMIAVSKQADPKEVIFGRASILVSQSLNQNLHQRTFLL